MIFDDFIEIGVKLKYSLVYLEFGEEEIFKDKNINYIKDLRLMSER